MFDFPIYIDSNDLHNIVEIPGTKYLSNRVAGWQREIRRQDYEAFSHGIPSFSARFA